MIRVFICPNCGKVRVVSKMLTALCYECDNRMVICATPYVEWVNLNLDERAAIADSYRHKGMEVVEHDNDKKTTKAKKGCNSTQK